MIPSEFFDAFKEHLGKRLEDILENTVIEPIGTSVGADYDVERPQIEDEPPLPGTAPAPMAALGGAVQGALESSETAEDVKQILREIREEMANNV
jgi:hypothetical protein